MRVVVIGTGYVGLVTGACLAEIGHEVTCVDIDKQKVASLKLGRIPIYEPGLSELVNKNRLAKRLNFTTQLTSVGSASVVIFALPTPPDGDGQADLSFVLGAARDIAPLLKGYTVLANKSTVPVGTARKVREVAADATDQEFDVVSNPEFLREGFAVQDFLQADRIVVGSSSKRALKVMTELYSPFTSAGVPLIAMDEASSELTKYAANSFLATKVSFMNEIANLCQLAGADVECVREGIGSDARIGRGALRAGIGYGGSCFPKDILALHRSASYYGYDFKILEAVRQVNERQKRLLVERVVEYFGGRLKGKTIALWGLAFKPDTDDIREAPALEIIKELLRRGVRLQAYDPEAIENTKKIFPEGQVVYAKGALEALEGAEALLIATEWKEFAAVKPDVLAKKLKQRVVFDGRNIFKPEVMARGGLTYFSVGRRQIDVG